MKKFITIVMAFIALAVFASCEKIAAEEESRNVIVSFSTSVGEGYSMTRGTMDLDAIRYALSVAKPDYVILKLTKISNGNTRKVATGEALELPSGEYKVELFKGEGDMSGGTWCYSDVPIGSNDSRHRGWNNWCDGTSATGTAGFNQNPFFKYPLFSMESFVVEIKEDCNISVKLQYDCSALVYDNTKCKTPTHTVSTGVGTSNVFCCNFSYENISIVYVKNVSKSISLTMSPQNNDENLEERKYTFNASNLEKGKFYILDCYECEKIETGTSIETNDWEMGELN